MEDDSKSMIEDCSSILNLTVIIDTGSKNQPDLKKAICQAIRVIRFASLVKLPSFHINESIGNSGD